MKEWRFPFGQSPEVVFIVLDPGVLEHGPDNLLAWLESVLPLLNWRSHLFATGDAGSETERFSLSLMEIAAGYLDRCGFANLHVHPLVRILSGDKSPRDVGNRLIAILKPFQKQALESMSEARLHLAPILAPSPGVPAAEALRFARFFRTRMAIPSFYLPGGRLRELFEHSGGENSRYFIDSGGKGLANQLWKSHVFETILDRIEEGRRPLISPCGSHLVLDAGKGGVYSCFKSWEEGRPGVDITGSECDPAIPAPPGTESCPACIVDAMLSMRENIVANKRETEGRKVCFELSLEFAGMEELAFAGKIAHSAFELSISNEDKVAALIQEALCLRDSGKLEKADEILIAAGGFTADKGMIAYHRGRVQFVWRDYIEALYRFEEALESGSRSIPVEDMCFEMAICHINIGEYPEARPYLDRSEKTGERKATVAFYRGICDYGESRFETASGFFREALGLGPAAEDLGRVWFYIGASLKELERYEEAAEALVKAVTADPDDIANHNLLGFCHYKLKRHKEAVACFVRAVEIDPGSGIDWANLASNLRDLGRTKEAIAMYRKALSLDPGIGFARDSLKKLTGRKT